MESAYAAQGAAFLQTCGAEVLGLDMSGVQAPQTVEISDLSGEPTAAGAVRLPIPLAPTESRTLVTAGTEPPAALLDAQRSLVLLIELGSILASAPASEVALEQTARLLVPQLADWCLVDALDDHGQRQRVAVAAADPQLLLPPRELPLCLHDEPSSRVHGCAPYTRQQVGTPDDSQVLAAPAEPELVDRLDASDPHTRDLSSCLTLPLSAHGRLLGMLMLAMGTSGRVYSAADLPLAEEVARRIALTLEDARSQQQLEEREQRLQDLADRLVLAQEEERRQLAYDVHDGVAQVATSLHQHLQMFAQQMDGQAPQGLHAELTRIVELAKRTVRELRHVVGHLRPALLDEQGLGPALCQLVADLRAEGWRIAYANALEAERLPQVVETVLFRVAQEALTNVRKHARTTEVEVTLARRDDMVSLEVRDRGRGFDPKAVAQADEQAGAEGHVGLHSMRDRMKLLGGRCEIMSHPGDGTRVVAEVQVVLGGKTGEMGAGR